jgi:hypothetical protein
MFTKNVNPRRRGRPPGPTVAGAQTRQRLYEAAIRRIAADGYEPVTTTKLRRRRGEPGPAVATFRANAVVLALYDELSAAFVVRRR